MTWVTAWISVVDLLGSVGERRPFDLTRLEAKMVLIRVDFPRPVWPVDGGCQHIFDNSTSLVAHILPRPHCPPRFEASEQS